MDTKYADRFIVLDHPLVDHKLSVIRDKKTPTAIFRTAVKELGLLAAYETTKHLRTHEKDVETPVATAHCKTIAGNEPVVVPILRAGLGMLDAFLELIPTAYVGHLGMKRNEETHEPEEYYAHMPEGVESRQCLIVDPMLATGGSLIAAIAAMRERGAKDITCCVLVAAPEGVKAVMEADPEVRVVACALDDGLTEKAYITPGLGDAGDRIFRTEEAGSFV